MGSKLAKIDTNHGVFCFGHQMSLESGEWIDARRPETMVCDEYKQLNGDKAIADECSVIDSPNRNIWLVKSAQLRNS
jgi:hypothetical protein